MAKYQSALTGAQMDSALSTMNQVATVSGIVESDGDGTFSARSVDSTPTASSTNLITSGGVKTQLDTKPDKDSSSSAFTIGRDTDGFYVSY